MSSPFVAVMIGLFICNLITKNLHQAIDNDQYVSLQLDTQASCFKLSINLARKVSQTSIKTHVQDVM